MKQNWIFLLFEIGKTDSHDPDSCKFPSFFSKILLEHSREPNRKVSIYTHANIIYACEWTVFAFCYTDRIIKGDEILEREEIPGLF